MIIAGVFTGTVVQIPAGYQGIALRFGAVSRTLSPGIHTIMPGAESVVLVETRTQKEESQATAASRDLQTVTTSLAVNYHIDPQAVGKLYSEVGTEYEQRVIDPAVQETIKKSGKDDAARVSLMNAQNILTGMSTTLAKIEAALQNPLYAKALDVADKVKNNGLVTGGDRVKELYDIPADKANDLEFIKRKLQELKDAAELSREISAAQKQPTQTPIIKKGW